MNGRAPGRARRQKGRRWRTRRTADTAGGGHRGRRTPREGLWGSEVCGDGGREGAPARGITAAEGVCGQEERVARAEGRAIWGEASRRREGLWGPEVRGSGGSKGELARGITTAEGGGRSSEKGGEGRGGCAVWGEAWRRWKGRAVEGELGDGGRDMGLGGVWRPWEVGGAEGGRQDEGRVFHVKHTPALPSNAHSSESRIARTASGAIVPMMRSRSSIVANSTTIRPFRRPRSTFTLVSK